MRILIAEDDFTSRSILAAVLRKGGYEVVETVSGAVAWDALQQPNSPSLLILDWMMPEMDGLEVVRRVRDLQSPQPPYIIMLTARGEKADIIAGLEAGADDYLAKPFDPGELRARVEVGRRMVEMQAALIESREKLAHQATHDPLTGLLNRQAILDRLREELARVERYGDLLAVGMCDVDHFKRVNDSYGHQAGDDVLCGLTETLKASIREYDALGRMGGEEFLVIAPMKEEMGCTSIFDRMCARIAESEISTRSGPMSVTVSIGVACSATGSTVDELLEKADLMLYRAKNEGRNRVAFAGEAVHVGNQPSAS